MDLLSITASVASVLTLAGEITNSLAAVASTTGSSAPLLMTHVLNGTESLVAIFSQLQSHLLLRTPIFNNHVSQVSLEHLSVMLASCVVTFSELHTELQGLVVRDAAMGWWNRVRWPQREGALQKIVEKLAAHRACLNYILTVLPCESESHAELSTNETRIRVDIPIESNERLSTLMQRRSAGEYSTRGPDEEEEDDKPDTLRRRSRMCRPTVTPGEAVSQSLTPLHHPVDWEFEDTLLKSRVYSRMGMHSTSGSSRSVKTLESPWSQLTDISSADISNISVVTPSVRRNELPDSCHWFNFDSSGLEEPPDWDNLFYQGFTSSRATSEDGEGSSDDRSCSGDESEVPNYDDATISDNGEGSNDDYGGSIHDTKGSSDDSGESSDDDDDELILTSVLHEPPQDESDRTSDWRTADAIEPQQNQLLPFNPVRPIKMGLALLGSTCTGKSGLLHKSGGPTVYEKYSRTFLDGGLELDILDTSGLTEYHHLRHLAIDSCELFLLVYCTEPHPEDSWLMVKDLVYEIRERKARGSFGGAKAPSNDYSILIFENHYGMPRRHEDYSRETRQWANDNGLDFVTGDSHDLNMGQTLFIRLASNRKASPRGYGWAMGMITKACLTVHN
ncbi:hypothetical protein BZA05DRAFT_477281 [Tricharina praecox]|uniref:uncharacterized protein n=1 Tax=Tricharina praecox TaxID=43433 RepID=UPI00221E9F04|nr:uncharacterized protein BZA05DRAFT_477281 [Tricharina praecox]KAI5843293.1 hypothetical protein BZA05DRAFT_477281 [Tricharina praecox]